MSDTKRIVRWKRVQVVVFQCGKSKCEHENEMEAICCNKLRKSRLARKTASIRNIRMAIEIVNGSTLKAVGKAEGLSAQTVRQVTHREFSRIRRDISNNGNGVFIVYGIKEVKRCKTIFLYHLNKKLEREVDGEPKDTLRRFRRKPFIARIEA